MIWSPPGEKATLVTFSVCPDNVRNSRPLNESQTLTVWSKLPLTIFLPLGEKATLVTVPECPSNERNSRPLAASHSLMPSSPPLTICCPVGEKATLHTGVECPMNRSYFATVTRTPENKRFIPTTGNDPITSRRKSDTLYIVFVPVKGSQTFPLATPLP